MTSPDNSLGRHLEYLLDALAASESAPLSLRKAMLTVMLVDAFADLLAAANGGDILEFRQHLADRSAELAVILEVAAMRDGGPRLRIEPVEVPLTDYPTLSTADFMVSLYNAHTVQRVLIALPDGSRRQVHDVLRAALDALGTGPNAGDRTVSATDSR